MQQTLPVRPGPLTLYFPRWLPGQHSPAGDVNQLAGLKISARGQALARKRDTLDTHAFKLDVPVGGTALRPQGQDGGTPHCAPATLEMLVDSPCSPAATSAASSSTRRIRRAPPR